MSYRQLERRFVIHTPSVAASLAQDCFTNTPPRQRALSRQNMKMRIASSRSSPYLVLADSLLSSSSSPGPSSSSSSSSLRSPSLHSSYSTTSLQHRNGANQISNINSNNNNINKTNVNDGNIDHNDNMGYQQIRQYRFEKRKQQRKLLRSRGRKPGFMKNRAYNNQYDPLQVLMFKRAKRKERMDEIEAHCKKEMEKLAAKKAMTPEQRAQLLQRERAKALGIPIKRKQKIQEKRRQVIPIEELFNQKEARRRKAEDIACRFLDSPTREDKIEATYQYNLGLEEVEEDSDNERPRTPLAPALVLGRPFGFDVMGAVGVEKLGADSPSQPLGRRRQRGGVIRRKDNEKKSGRTEDSKNKEQGETMMRRGTLRQRSRRRNLIASVTATGTKAPGQESNDEEKQTTYNPTSSILVKNGYKLAPNPEILYKPFKPIKDFGTKGGSLRLRFSLENLPDVGMCLLLIDIRTKRSKRWVHVGRTEYLSSASNPKFLSKYTFSYKLFNPTNVAKMRLAVYTASRGRKRIEDAILSQVVDLRTLGDQTVNRVEKRRQEALEARTMTDFCDRVDRDNKNHGNNYNNVTKSKTQNDMNADGRKNAANDADNKGSANGNDHNQNNSRNNSNNSTTKMNARRQSVVTSTRRSSVAVLSNATGMKNSETDSKNNEKKHKANSKNKKNRNKINRNKKNDNKSSSRYRYEEDYSSKDGSNNNRGNDNNPGEDDDAEIVMNVNMTVDFRFPLAHNSLLDDKTVQSLANANPPCTVVLHSSLFEESINHCDFQKALKSVGNVRMRVEEKKKKEEKLENYNRKLVISAKLLEYIEPMRFGHVDRSLFKYQTLDAPFVNPVQLDV